MWLQPMLLVEMYLTPARLSARSVGFVTRVLWPTLMQLPATRSMVASEIGAAVMIGVMPKRADSYWNSAASSGSHPKIVMPASRSALRTAVPAGSL